jgi:hypothetical protein
MSEISNQICDTIRGLRLPGYGDDEVGFMAETVERLRPDFVGDWGTNRGSSARIFYEASKACLPAAIRIVTVDLPTELEPLDRDHAGQATALFLKGTPVKRLRGDGVTTALSAYVRSGCGSPLFFLDGDHLKENVFREIVLINRLAPTAVMLCHDTRNGPGTAIADFMARTPGSYTVEFLASQAGMTRLWPNLP